ncbi:hypothetical protein [Streptomyces sp. NPDC057325]|uniref:hypothetical protein n=1 Tax=unclassified Streptomyces TaxID=2593676 RepID=UPI003641D58A
MRKSHQILTDAEITRRTAVDPQRLQCHRDLEAEAEAVRAHLAQERPRTAAAATARKEAPLVVENRMLLEQNAALQRILKEVHDELRRLRAHELGARLRDGRGACSPYLGELLDPLGGEEVVVPPAAAGAAAVRLVPSVRVTGAAVEAGVRRVVTPVERRGACAGHVGAPESRPYVFPLTAGTMTDEVVISREDLAFRPA